MGLRVKTNIASQMVQNNLSKVSGKAQDSLAKLSSGKRITKAADDAAGLAIATKMGAETRGLRQAKRNANDGVSLVQTAEGGLNEVSNILGRMRELTIQAASDTIGEDERGFLDKEYQQLVSEVDRISDSTNYGSIPLLNGESSDGLDFQVGAFGGESNRITFDASATDATASGIGIDGSGIADKSDARGAIDTIDQAIGTVSGYRAELGAVQNRLQSTVSNLDVQIVNQDSSRSKIEDVDVASETAKLASSQILTQAGMSSLAQANSISSNALKLL